MSSTVSTGIFEGIRNIFYRRLLLLLFIQKILMSTFSQMTQWVIFIAIKCQFVVVILNQNMTRKKQRKLRANTWMKKKKERKSSLLIIPEQLLLMAWTNFWKDWFIIWILTKLLIQWWGISLLVVFRLSRKNLVKVWFNIVWSLLSFRHRLMLLLQLRNNLIWALQLIFQLHSFLNQNIIKLCLIVCIVAFVNCDLPYCYLSNFKFYNS